MKRVSLWLLTLSVPLLIVVALEAPAQDKGAQTWSARAQQGDYRIAEGDLLEISTWKEPDLSRRDVMVRLDGKISFPLLGDVQAAGVPPMELKDKIEKGLKTFVSNPVVTVTVTNPASQRFYILGEVAKTGEYPLTKNLNVLQAFALAGGFTQWASKSEIILFRKEGGKDRIYTINYKDILKGRESENNLNLQANDTIVVP
jgi:polysaccharide export outer membrane protein